MEIFENCNTRTTYLKLTTRKMQVLIVCHKNIKFVTFYNFNTRSCLHDNLENTPFCFKKLHFQNNRFRRAAFCEIYCIKRYATQSGPFRTAVPREFVRTPPSRPLPVDTDSFRTLPPSYQANITVF